MGLESSSTTSKTERLSHSSTRRQLESIRIRLPHPLHSLADVRHFPPPRLIQLISAKAEFSPPSPLVSSFMILSSDMLLMLDVTSIQQQQIFWGSKGNRCGWRLTVVPKLLSTANNHHSIGWN